MTLPLSTTLDILLAAKRKHADATSSLRSQVELLEHDWQTGDVHAELFTILEVFIKACEQKKSPRLIIELPPGFGKTLMVSRHLPAFIWSKHPKWFQIVGTYNQDRANEVGRDFRRVMENPTFQELHPQLQIDSRAASMDYLETTQGGKLSFVGVGAGATGKRAHCIAAGTLIHTETGPRPIEDIKPGERVWSYDIPNQTFELQPVLAATSSGVQPTRRITLENGHTIECTDEHLILQDNHYVRADTLAVGDYVDGIHIQLPALSGPEDGADNPHPPSTPEVLRPPLPRVRQHQTPAPVRAMWQASVAFVVNHAALFARMLRCVVRGARGTDPETCPVRAVPDDRTENILPSKILWGSVQECSARREDDRSREPTVHRRGSGLAVHDSLPAEDRAADPCARQSSMCALFAGERETPSRTPYRPQQDERCGRESHNAMHGMPHHVPQAARWRIEAVHEGSYASVHDLQVRENCNFIAVSVVVHNSFVVDDPFKDMQEAESAAVRHNVYSWFFAVAYTRMLPGAGIIVLHTRWHEADLIGQLLAAAKIGGDQWMHYRFPLLAEQDEFRPDGTLRRKKGASLHPERFPPSMCQQMKDTYYAAKQGRIWSALYQQNPVPDDGNFFKMDWFKRGFYDPSSTSLPVARTYGITTDFASSEESGDRSISWPFFLDDRDDIWFLDDIFIEQCETIKHSEDIWAKVQKYDARYLFVERGVLLNAHRPEFRTQQTRRKLYNVKLVEFSRTKKKKEHSVALANHMAQGKVHFPDTPFFRERILPLFLGFDNLTQDDPIDAAALPFLSFHEMMKPDAPVDIPDLPEETDASSVQKYIKKQLDDAERPPRPVYQFFADDD